MPAPKDPIKYQAYIIKQRDSHLGKKGWNKGLYDNPRDWMKRFNSKYTVLSNGCWEWNGGIHPKTGYGLFWKNGTNVLPHRFSYEMFNGPIPAKLTVDHLCKNRRCVNPNHLDLATRHENARRGNNEIANNSSKTHCPRGHEYSEKNTYRMKKGGRACRKCFQIRKKEYRKRKKEIKV